MPSELDIDTVVSVGSVYCQTLCLVAADVEKGME